MFRAFVREELCLSLVGSLVCLAWLAAQLPAAEPQDDPFGDKPATAAPVDPKLDAATVPQPRSTPVSSAEHQIRHALSDPTAMDFTETPLQDAIDYLRDLHGITIQLDTRALEAAGVGSDTPVTRVLTKMTLAPALRLLLSPMDLTAVVKDDVLLITTVDALQQEYSLRVYDVADLMKSGESDKPLAETLRMLLARPVATAAKADSEGKASSAGSAEADKLQIVAYRNLLLVRASFYDHERLDQLLGDMRIVLGTTNR